MPGGSVPLVDDVTSSDDGALHPGGGYSLNSLYEGEGGSLVSSPCDEEEEGVTPGVEGAHPSALHGTNSPRLTLILLCSAQVRFLLPSVFTLISHSLTTLYMYVCVCLAVLSVSFERDALEPSGGRWKRCGRWHTFSHLKGTLLVLQLNFFR